MAAEKTGGDKRNCKYEYETIIASLFAKILLYVAVVFALPAAVVLLFCLCLLAGQMD